MESRPQEHASHHDSASMGGGGPSECHGLPVFTLVEAANDTRIAQLARTIEQEIIPRLMLAHRVSPRVAEPKPPAAERRIEQDDIERFAKLILGPEDDRCDTVVAAYRDQGVSIESIYIDLLAPVARYLGYLWEEDLCSFCDVTIGLGRLQRTLRELSMTFERQTGSGGSGLRILLVPSPGEQHTLGLVMVGEFFRRAGWSVEGGAWTTGVDAASLVKREWFDTVGFSLGAEIHLAELTAAICAVRQASCNRQVTVLVGGPLFGAHPEFAEKVGADGMTIDGREAPALAERLIGPSRERGAVQRG